MSFDEETTPASGLTDGSDAVTPHESFPGPAVEPPIVPPVPAPAGPMPAASGRRGWRLAAALFTITASTTLLTGVMLESGARGIEISGIGQLLADPSLLLLGLPYAVCVLGILGTHEMGHYVACRIHGIDATPPYFLPSPPGFIFGTFGAFIRIRAPITNRRALFDIGVAGPLAGFVVAIPVLIWGTLTSEWRPDTPEIGGLYLGDSVAMKLLTTWVALPPPAPSGYVFALGSVGMAGWFGLLATGLNLLPVGQLDGGHIAYAVSGRFHRWMSRLSLVTFVVMGLAVNESWLFWAMVMIFLSPKHPSLVEETVSLSRRRLAVAALALLVLILCFIPDMARVVVPEAARSTGASLSG